MHKMFLKNRTKLYYSSKKNINYCLISIIHFVNYFTSQLNISKLKFVYNYLPFICTIKKYINFNILYN